jgi:hypothetical protein
MVSRKRKFLCIHTENSRRKRKLRRCTANLFPG